MIDVKIIKKPKSGRAAIGGGIATAGNSYTNDSQQTLADVLNFNAAVSRLLQPYDANNQPLAWAQATDPDGDGGIKAKTLRASVTFASVGDIVAYQNGNLSGGTSGGGLDITALESYLTTNGYATQDWVAAHFNDYVLTKAAVEAVLTGNITSHTHSQYLTEHQSLANYYTKAEVNTELGKYLLSSAYTASDILTKIKTVDGKNSGLDADTLDGYHASDFLRHRFIMSTATVNMDANNVPSNFVQHDFRWDNAPFSGYNIASILDLTYSPDWRTQLFVLHIAKTNILVRSRYNGTTWGDWRELAFTDSNVAAATRLQTSRTINGTAFDGTAAITTAKWGTARNITIGNTAKSVDGSGPVAWSLAEIGALGVNANAVSASKLQTARTIWGQSFDGTANVSGSLSGVEDITFNANAKIAATANHIRLLTKSGGPQGIAAAQLLASDLYADWAKVPAKGIYSKGDIATDGSLKIGGGTITWDAANNAFIFSHTVASQGDMVAFQNGNLSGGTGGGGLDITALEDYLTTNGYATQGWVSAHFNDYVLTKAAVEAVLTGNITTHTHSQYLTEHQSLANYYTKTEADGKYLTSITKSMVEAVLTGNITSHTHSQYLTAHQSLANYYTKAEVNTELGKYLLTSAYTASDILTKIKTVDGAGSGLDADTVDGYQALNFLRNRDSVSTADVHMNINEVPVNSVQHDYRWDNAPTGYSVAIASVLDLTYSPDWRTQLFVYHFAKTNIFVRSRYYGTTWDDWRELAFLDSNVASATKLQTARAINGTAFDGTVAITTAKWGTARNITIGNTAKSVDGSSAMAWSLAEIGALGVNANAVSASKLQTAHTLWGQSFDGTDNVAGTLSGVEDILFNVNARLNATDNAFRFYTKSGGAQGIQAGNLLISHLFSDANKVPANGIYSKDGLVTDGSIKIGGGTITWDEATNSFIFSHTVASQGDVVAFKQ